MKREEKKKKKNRQTLHCANAFDAPQYRMSIERVVDAIAVPMVVALVTHSVAESV
jgi:hypothetical protein